MKNYAVKFPKNIDIEQIRFFVEELSDNALIPGTTFWKGEDSPGDSIETVFARSADTDTVLGTIDVTEDLERLVTWLQALTEAE